MQRDFAQTMSELRREKGVSQRTAASELNISQALLSHYENGAREPGIPFICRACEYYGVSADYMLGISDEKMAYGKSGELRELLQEMRTLCEKCESILEENGQ